MRKISNDGYTKILNDELSVAIGCTEPIALAYGAAYAKKSLGVMPHQCIVRCSGNIIKNVKSVTIPQTNGLKGIEVAILAGALVGDPDLKLEVLSKLSIDQIEEIKNNIQIVKVLNLKSIHTLHIIIEMYSEKESVIVEIIGEHTNITKVVKNGKVILKNKENLYIENDNERENMNIIDILEYARNIDLQDVSDVLELQIKYNMAIANEGIINNWGARVGKNILSFEGHSIEGKIKAFAAAGSDARMNGCSMPVVINSGSGNQGLTVSIPVIIYASYIGASHEELLRALIVANLCAIHQKTSIGKLSAFCGVVSAATAGIVGIAYLDRVDYKCMARTIINSLANVGGMVCDGAKSSCAAKIVSALTSAMLAYEMAKNNCEFLEGEGIVSNDVEKMIKNIGKIAREGMKSTDQEILNIMINT